MNFFWIDLNNSQPINVKELELFKREKKIYNESIFVNLIDTKYSILPAVVEDLGFKEF